MPRPQPGPGRDAAVVFGVLLLLAVLCGVLWRLVVTPAEFTRLANGGAMDGDQLSRRFAADGWYVVLAVLAGFVAGALLSRWLSRDALVTSAALLAGSVVAAAGMALVGHLLGPSDPKAALAVAKVGARVPERLDVGMRPLWPFSAYLKDTVTIYLAWPVGVLAGDLFTLLGRAGSRPPVAPTSGGGE